MMLRTRLVSAFVFIALIGLVGVSPASVTEYLPESSHHQGSVSGDTYRIDFAVYDTQATNEFTFDAPGDAGRYVYAYQIFSANSEDFELFTLLGIGEGAIASSNVIGTVDDSSGGVDSSAQSFNDDKTEANWSFAEETLVDGTHSMLLILSSDNDWVAGSYELSSNPIPEPCTMLLLLGGSALLFRKKA